MHPQPAPSPAEAVFQVIQGFWLSRAIHAAAVLGIPDLVKDGPQSLDHLAAKTGTHAPSLYRLLRALSSAGWLTEDETGRFGPTSITAGLQTGVPGSLRNLAITELGQEHYPAWEELLHSLKTGEIAFNHRFGMPNWEFWSRNPDYARVFNAGMSDATALLEPAVVATYDFSRFQTIADLGGGNGGLLSAVLLANPTARGILFDLPHVLEEARQRLQSQSLTGRCQTIAGSFFEAAPAGADAYILKWILHDWTDEQCIAILQNCYRAMSSNGTLLILEAVIPGRNQPFLHKFLDLNMLVMTGGRERTLDEYRHLLTAAGFRLTRVVEAPGELSILESVKA